MLGLFNKGKEPTADIKNELNKELKHLDKALETLRTTDSVSKYGGAIRDMIIAYSHLESLEKNFDWKHGKYTWKGGVKKSMKSIQSQITERERKFVDRAYQKLQLDCAGLNTEKAKENKRNKFFEEFNAYSMFFDKSTMEYVESLRSLQSH